MRDLCAAAERVMKDTFSPEQLGSVEIRDSSAGNGAWVQRQYVVKAFEEALKYGNATARTIDVGTTVAATCSITTSFDGGSSTQLGIGTLDLVCQNGMTALNSVDHFRKKHTKSATADVFEDWLTDLGPRFKEQITTMKQWSDTTLTWTQIEETIRNLPSVSEKKAEKLLERAARECAERGFNVYALTSAFTYYSSHNSHEFPIRNTGNDNVATTLADRQTEVGRWVRSQPFAQLLAA
jgi:BarA-like signal transduction histidine kinase